MIDPLSGAETVLHSFCSEQNCADGQNPNAALILLDGTLYGTTTAGGANRTNCGAVFSIDPRTGAEKVLYSFCGQNHCSDGRAPDASLLAVNGLLYGTTSGGGVAGCGGYGCGTVFALHRQR